MKHRMFTAYWGGEEGKLEFTGGFHELHPVLRADFLQDVLIELEKLYEKAREEI